MTRHEAELIMKGATKGNPEDRFRYNAHLRIALLLMYYSHMLLDDIYNMEIGGIYTFKEEREDDPEPFDDGIAHYNTVDRRRKNMFISYDIRMEDYLEIQDYIKKTPVKSDRKGFLLQCSRENLRKRFHNIAAMFNIEGKLTDIYHAGRIPDNGRGGWEHYGFSEDYLDFLEEIQLEQAALDDE